MKSKHIILTAATILLIATLSGCSSSPTSQSPITNNVSPENQAIKVESYENPNERGYTLTSTLDECIITWRIDSNINVQSRNCSKKSFSETKDTHRAILAELLNRENFTNFPSLRWGGGSVDDDNQSGCIALAKASIASPKYQDYKLNYPNSEITSIGALYIELANKVGKYKELNNLFNEFGTEIKLDSVEKTGTKLVSDLLCKDKLIEMGIAEDERVLSGAAINYLKISKIPAIK